MKKNFKAILIVILISVLLSAAVSIPVYIIYSRPPVLIICEQSFLELYGEKRVKREARLSAIVLFRQVKTVTVANEAGDDIIFLAACDEPTTPFCVIFPFRFARAAKLYSEQNPSIPVVLLEGRFPVYARPSSFAISTYNSDYFIYKTDVEYDFYRAGTAAAAVVKNAEQEAAGDTENRIAGKIAVFWNRNFSKPINNFKQAVSDFDLGKVHGTIRGTGQEEEYIEQGAMNNEQAAINRELPPEDGEQVFENNEQAALNGEQPPEDGGQVSENNEQAAVNGEQAADGSEQAAANGGQTAEISQQAAANGEQAAEGSEQASEGTEHAEGDNYLAEGGDPAEVSSENGELLPEIQFFSDFSQFNEDSRLSCVVIIDHGVEYLDRKPTIPVIIFSWLDISLMPDEVVLIIDDSPWAQATEIVKMVQAGVKTGIIPSKFHFLSESLFDKGTMRKIKKIWKMIK